MPDSKRPKPTYLAERRMENGRLAYYLDAADAGYWDSQWSQFVSEVFYAEAERGILDPTLQGLSLQYLPREGHIIEAGCGLGQVVLGLKVHGYDIEGVEWGEKTVEAAKALKPDLPIRVGDVTALDVPDGHYSGYISLGVVEHRRGGPEPFFQEAYRILRPGGVALISVPYLNPLRSLKARLGIYRGRPEGLVFYQYAFDKTELCTLLEAAGFEIIVRVPHNGYKGLKDEIPPLRWMLTWPVIGQRLRHWLIQGQPAERLGHMVMVVCRKVVRQ